MPYAQTYRATGFPALLIFLGVIGVLVSIGIFVARRPSLGAKVVGASVAAIVLGIVIENLD